VPELPDYGHTVRWTTCSPTRPAVRDWTGLLPLAEQGADVLPLILRQRGLNFAPGEAWAYSNSGFVLLKEIVARASGTSFAEFARRRLFAPLGMTSSAYVADILQGTGERALGYQKEGAGWKPYMRLGNERGGGAVVSTAGDLLVWNDALTNGRLGAFVTAKLQEQTKLRNGRTLSYARGLIVDRYRGGPLVSHSGGAAGFSTWLGRFPAQGLSVAVLCNFDPVSATALARRVADLYVPADAGTGQAQAAANGAGAAGVDVTGRAGLFFDERTGEPMRLLVNDGRLRIANGPALVAVAPDRFRNRAATCSSGRRTSSSCASLAGSARADVDGGADHAVPPRRSVDARRRRPAGRRRPVRERGARVGLRDRARATGLVMRFERRPDRSLELTPVERDTYMRRMMIVRVRRDRGGRVVGFDYGNPLGATSGSRGWATAPAPRPPRLRRQSTVRHPPEPPSRLTRPRRGWRGSRASTRSRPGARSRSRSTAASSTDSRRAARSAR
jgi:hypothetical protein